MRALFFLLVPFLIAASDMCTVTPNAADCLKPPPEPIATAVKEQEKRCRTWCREDKSRCHIACPPGKEPHCRCDTSKKPQAQCECAA